MILSRTAVYALNAVLYLAEASDGKPRSVDDIAKALDVPRNYLSKVLHVIVRGGILDSTRGPHGGFAMARDPSKVRLSEVIGPFDDITETSTCLLGRARCSDENPCAAHGRWKRVSEEVSAFLRETTLADLSASDTGVQQLTG